MTKNKAEWRDPIVEEIHRFREEYAKKFDYDPEKMFLDLRRRQEESGDPVVSFSPKPAVAANPPIAPARPSKRRGT
ncbi:MAG: hypothetical protein JF614_06120 [Acidobacteria bacterium]|nr:hypothetical protein [Acidobacteriota bacterium]